MPVINSEDYHDYVIAGGKLIGEFDQMYRKSRDVPWHQDKDPERLDCKIALNILATRAPYESIIDVGCGLGYFTNELSKLCRRADNVMGTDVSPAAIEKARQLFPQFNFETLDITRSLEEQGWGERKGSLVVVRGIFWYVFPHIDLVCKNIKRLIDDNGYVLIQQNFPPLDSKFVGKEVLPKPETLLRYFKSDIQELIVNYLEDNKEKPSNDNWVYMFGRKK